MIDSTAGARTQKPSAGAAVLTTCLALVLTASCGPEQQPPRFDKVLVISADTLRADYLGTYNPMLEWSPNLDRFAEQSFVFTDALTGASSTLTSHTTLFYSLHTLAHLTSTHHIPEPQLEIPLDTLRRNGFNTAAIVGGLQLRPHLGFDRGFDSYDVVTTTYVPGNPPQGEDLQELLSQTAGFLEEHRDDKFLLFVHHYVMHYPHYPPERLLSIVEEQAAELDLSGIDETAPFLPPIDGGTATLADYLANERRLRYAALVLYMDEFLGNLLAEIESQGLADDLLIVFLSDHGDSHGERGRDGHGTYYREVVRVPLILHVPGLEGRRIDDPVQLVDVMPTVFSLLDVEPPYPFMGVDLTPALLGEQDVIRADRVRFSGHRNTRRERHVMSVVDGRWTLILDPDDPADRQLYDTIEDPGEVNNLAAAMPEMVEKLEDHYWREVVKTEGIRALFPVGDVTLEDLPQELIDDLRALGYIQ